MPFRTAPLLRFRVHRIGKAALLVVAAGALGLLAWGVTQVYRFRCEQQTKALLYAEAYPGALGLTSLGWVGGESAGEVPCWSFSELSRARLYAPVISVHIGGGGYPDKSQTLDQSVWESLRAFRYLEEFTISTCTPAPALSADFSGFANLQSISIVETPFSQQCLQSLSRLPALKDAIFYKAQGIDDWLPAISQLRHLQNLEIEGDLSDRAAASLASLEDLEQLSLTSAAITSAVAPALAKLKKLKVLSLSKTQVGDDGLHQLATMKWLTRLYIVDTNRITDDGVRHLGSLESLEALSLHGNRITSSSARTIARLTRLRNLLLPTTQIDDEGLRQLTELRYLRAIDLHGTRVAEVGVDLDYPRLVYLDLRDTKLNDTGIRHLSRLPQLRCLRISGTNVTDASIETLASMPALVDINATGCKIDMRGAPWLRLTKMLEDRRKKESNSSRR